MPPISTLLKACGTAIAIAVPLSALWIWWNADRAYVAVAKVSFVPAMPEPDKRFRIEFVLRNSGKVPAIIEAMTTDAFDDESSRGRYGFANILEHEIAPGGESRIISDLGTKPLVFSAAKWAAVRSGQSEMKIVGFVKYSDAASTLLGRTALGFCFVWESTDTPRGNFNRCSEPSWTFRRRFWFHDGLQMRTIPLGGVIQTVTPTTAVSTMPDPRYPAYDLEVRH